MPLVAPVLTGHVFQRLSEMCAGRVFDGDITQEKLRAFHIMQHRMYLHKVMHVNYTLYDMRREQDSINPRSHADIMMLAPHRSSHQYLYARVIAIFHVNASLLNPQDDVEPEPELIHILWVQWFELNTSVAAGYEALRPFQLQFAGLEEDPFTFISPSQVLHSVYLIPAFEHRHTDTALPYTSVTRGEDENDDYTLYNIGM